MNKAAAIIALAIAMAAETVSAAEAPAKASEAASADLTLATSAARASATVAASAWATDRGITSLDSRQTPFMVRGNVMMGGFASYSMSSASNKVYTLDIHPCVFYAIADNLAIGAKGIYKRSFIDIESAGIDLGATGISAGGLSLDIKDYYALKQSYGANVVLRKFLPLGSSGRFALYTDGLLGIETSSGKYRNSSSGTTEGCYEKAIKMKIGINPGLAIHFSDNLCISAGVGFIGVGWENTKQQHNRVDEGGHSGLYASYMMNPLEFELSSCYSFGGGSYENLPMLEKGEWAIGGSVLYADASASDSQLLMLVSGLDLKGSVLRISPEISHAFSDNGEIGVRCTYTLVNISDVSASLQLGEALNLSVSDLSYSNTSWSGEIYNRKYMGLVRSGSVGLFRELALGYDSTRKMHLCFRPGLSLFVLPSVSIDACLGLAELAYSFNKLSTRLSASAALALKNCSFGIKYHLGGK